MSEPDSIIDLISDDEGGGGDGAGDETMEDDEYYTGSGSGSEYDEVEASQGEPQEQEQEQGLVDGFVDYQTLTAEADEERESLGDYDQDAPSDDDGDGGQPNEELELDEQQILDNYEHEEEEEPQQQQQHQHEIQLHQQPPLQPIIHSPSDPSLIRVLNALRLPHLKDSLKAVSTQIPDFSLFLTRLNSVLTLDEDDNSIRANDKGKQVVEYEDPVTEDLVLLRKKAELGKMRLDLELDFEERAHVFESETRKLRDQLAAKQQQKQEQLQQQENVLADGSADNTRSSTARLKESLDKSAKEIAELKAAIIALEADKRNLGLIVNGKIQETDSYFREMQQLRKDLESSRTESRTIQDQLHQSQNGESKYKLLHLNSSQEVDMMKQNLEWVQQELVRKTDEFRTYRSEKSQEVHRLQQSLEDMSNSKNLYEIKSRKLEERVEAGEKRIFDLLAQVQEEKEKVASQAQSFKNEMNTQINTAEHYQQQYQELVHQFNEHQSIVRDTQHALDELIASKTAAENKVVELETTNQEKGIRLADLEKQVEAINRDAIGSVAGTELSIISPAAQTANALRKSGKTFTQIYLEFIALGDENIGLKSDVARLTEHLNDVLNDINERAPIIKQVTEDKKLLEQEVEKLLQEVARCEDARAEAVAFATGSKEQLETLLDRNKSLEQESHDLGRQVQHLLLELERLKSGPTMEFRSRSPILRNSDPSAATNSGRLISERLVLFDSITELQSQNQQLRSSLRNVSDALAKVERNVSEQVEERVRRELEETVVVLDDLREQIRVGNLKYDTIVRERDELRWELENEDGVGGGRNLFRSSSIGPGGGGFGMSVGSLARGDVGGVSTPRFGASRPGTPLPAGRFFDPSGAALNSVQNEFEEYKRASVGDIQKLRELNESLSQVKADLDVQVARLQSSVDNGNERNRSLIEQLEASKLECRQLHIQVESYLKQQSTNEARLQEVSNQFNEARSSLESQTTELRMLRSDRETLVIREAKFAAENESLTQHLNSVKEQLVRVQKLYDETNLFGRENAANAEEKVKGLEGQISLLRAQLTAAQEDIRVRSLRYETNISDARYQIERLNSDLAEAVRLREVSKGEERRLAQHSEDLKLRLTSAERKVDQLQSSIHESLSTPESVKLRDARGEIEQLKMDLQTTENALEAQRTDAEQYKAIAASAEEKLVERLTEFNTTYDRFKAEMEQKVSSLQTAKSQLEQSKKNVENQLAEVSLCLEKDRETSGLEVKALQTSNADLHAKLSKLENDELISSASIKSLQDELTVLQSRLVESREAYERVIRAEAERIKNLEAIRKELHEAREEVLQYKEQSLFAEGDLEANRNLWETAKSKLIDELASLKKTNEDLTVQNKILHNQFESVSARMSSSSAILDGEGFSAAVGSQEEQERLELIRHLRRDKDNLVKDYEVAKQNIERLQKQVDQLQLLLSESRTNLENVRFSYFFYLGFDFIPLQERKSQKTAGEMEGLHKELLSKIDRVNVLTESNATLRHHNNVITRKLESLEGKLKASEARTVPLKEQNTTLLAEIEAFKSQIHSLEAENTKLMGRANEILGKYNRVDPVEHQGLKDQAAELTTKLSKAEADAKTTADKLAELTRSAETRVSSLNAELNDLRVSLHSSKEEVAKLKDDLAESSKSTELVPTLRAEVEALKEKVKSKITEANKLIVTKNAKIAELNEEKRGLEEANANLTKLSESFETEKLDWQATNQMLEKINAELSSKLEGLGAENTTMTEAVSDPKPEEPAPQPVVVQLQQTPQLQSAVPPSPSPSSKRPREEASLPIASSPLHLASGSKTAEPLVDESATKRPRVGDTSVDEKVEGAIAIVSSAIPVIVPTVPTTVGVTASPAPVKILRTPTTAIAPVTFPIIQEPPAPTASESANETEVAQKKSSLNALLQKKMENLKKGGAAGPDSPGPVSQPSSPVPAPTTSETPTANVSVFAQPPIGILGKGNVRIRPPNDQTQATPVPSPASVGVRPSRGRPGGMPNQPRQPIQQIQYVQNPQTPTGVRPGGPLRRPPRAGSIGISPIGGVPQLQQQQGGPSGLGRGQGRPRPPPQ
ncbi:UNVERIFIED_CONTAM: hypothetical protein HDU68_004491 [Siphonaria sp. JEL0065]|nr:hypothetical protein HDU68_004491 [Siphonaria sp. JEL0065]